MKKHEIFGIVCLCLMLGCATTSSVQVDKSVDFSTYHSYAWQGLDPSNQGARPVSIVLNPHVTRVVNQELAEKGWLLDPKNPDLLVATYMTLNTSSVFASNTPPDVEKSYTLVLDFYDAQTHARLWRGWANVSINSNETEHIILDRVTQHQGDLTQSVKRMLVQFPISKR